MGLKVAVVGATGAVGTEMLRILQERAFPVDELIPLASARSAGRTIRFGGGEVTVQELSLDALRGVDLSLSAAGASIARGFVRDAAAAGTVCIDKSSAFRMEPDVPLVVPEVNPEALEGSPKIIAVPNCTTIVAMMALAPLHRAAGLRSLVLSSYQAVSGAGRDGTRELAEQVEKLHDQVEELGHPDFDALPAGDVFGKTMAFNVLPKIDRFAEDGSTGEEIKTVNESRRSSGIPTWTWRPRASACRCRSGTRCRCWPGSPGRSTRRKRGRCSREAPGVELRDEPGERRLPVAARGRRPRRGPGGSHPAGAGPRRRPAPVRVRRQPPEGCRPERDPDRGAPLLHRLTTPTQGQEEGLVQGEIWHGAG